ncbi:DNA-binding transcriptional regulator, MarR family [Desulfotomaculum arcticum]|uniref:DNA-binding transcriptional regulator, MarR family n=1 Tax=Desulfotruncus arcticus DSM 17038 TaxID=1121424 RepID=A0A1I2YPZ7_9FIRM|nr:MarR family transcriptional regulator [Desulfotruncus arcticus]SFH27575.1 DNA-binding transcriptional regulator, MarR family [Desulfotomaculum arcticum] [Desulfotruncus arcticus DSM 17038]
MSNHHESVGKWISTIHRYSMIYKSRNVIQYGVGAGQWEFLNVLYQKDGISQDELAHKLNMDKTTTTRAVQKLESLGFVRRQSSEEDRRINLLFLTKMSLGIKTQFQSAMQQWTEILVQGFSEDERDLLLNMLKKISKNAVDYISDMERNV